MPSCFCIGGVTEVDGISLPALLPNDEQAQKVLSKLAPGEPVQIKFKRGRSVQHHRKFFAILRTVIENTDKWPNETALLDAIKIALGHVETIVTISGEVAFKPKSIDFSRMGQDEFDKFYNDAMDLICTKILPGVDRLALEGER